MKGLISAFIVLIILMFSPYQGLSDPAIPGGQESGGPEGLRVLLFDPTKLECANEKNHDDTRVRAFSD